MTAAIERGFDDLEMFLPVYRPFVVAAERKTIDRNPVQLVFSWEVKRVPACHYGKLVAARS
jgi:hypothetical protein